GPRPEGVLLLDVRQEAVGPRAGLVPLRGHRVGETPVPWGAPDLGIDAVHLSRGRAAVGREEMASDLEVDHAGADLFEVVLALDPRRGGAHLLYGGEQQADEHRDDGYDDEKFDQREGASGRAGARLGGDHRGPPADE